MNFKNLFVATIITACSSFIFPSAVEAQTASWYGNEYAGRPVACQGYGTFNPNALTAAHRTLPCGTRVQVTNPATGRSVIVRITDRGPFTGGRVIDLSRRAFSQIGSISRGVMRVQLRVLR